MKPLVFILFVCISISVPVAFGAIQWVTLATDKPVYLDGDTVTIRGTVFQLYSSTPLTIMVIAPNENVVYLDQLTVSRDKKFSTEFKVGGDLMKIVGDYRVIAQYGSETRKATITFHYGSETPKIAEIIIPQPRQIKIDGFVMASTMTLGEVTNMSPNRNEKMLTISVNGAVSSGTLTIAVPRTILDSVTNGADGEFFAFVDGNNVNVEEVDTNEFERTLIIDYPVGTRTIELIGTYAIPEFGGIGVMILLAATITTFLVLQRHVIKNI